MIGNVKVSEVIERQSPWKAEHIVEGVVVDLRVPFRMWTDLGPPVALGPGGFLLPQDHVHDRIRYRVPDSQDTMIVGIAQPKEPAIVSRSDPEDATAEADLRIGAQDRKLGMSCRYGVKGNRSVVKR